MPTINQTDAQGRPTGPWEEYHATGAVSGRGEYVDGEKHGEWNYFFRTGRLRATGRMDAGRLSGFWTWYRESGGKLQEGAFVDGEQHGPWKRWYETGSLIDEGEWDHGRKVGEWRYYDKDGSLRRTTVHRG